MEQTKGHVYVLKRVREKIVLQRQYSEAQIADWQQHLHRPVSHLYLHLPWCWQCPSCQLTGRPAWQQRLPLYFVDPVSDRPLYVQERLTASSADFARRNAVLWTRTRATAH